MSTRTQLEAAFPACTITYGWTLAGPGPARFGWARTTAAGDVTYLGRNPTDTRPAIYLHPMASQPDHFRWLDADGLPLDSVAGPRETMIAAYREGYRLHNDRSERL